MDLYVILDPSASGERDLVGLADAVLEAGARWIQLRDKAAPTGRLTGLAARIRERVKAAGGVFIVNDRLDVALAVDADGVHLGQEDLPLQAARRLGPDLVLGVSTHNLEQARQAQAAGADYLALGSVFPTGSKPSFKLVGLETLTRVRPHVTVPLVAIGGITPDRVPAVLAAGADGIAVISAIGLAPDPTAAVASFLSAIRQGRLDTSRTSSP
ncbi:MAG: thiamine phosphate synthase [Candidatus Rokuibacteriota bacterium]